MAKVALYLTGWLGLRNRPLISSPNSQELKRKFLTLDLFSTGLPKRFKFFYPKLSGRVGTTWLEEGYLTSIRVGQEKQTGIDLIKA